MTADAILTGLRAAGLTLYLGDDGAPRVRGPAEGLTPELAAALRENRAKLVDYLQLPRRIVLLTDGRDSGVQAILWQGERAGVTGRLREYAAAYRGKTLALEWASKGGWMRYLWIMYPEASHAEAAPASVA